MKTIVAPLVLLTVFAIAIVVSAEAKPEAKAGVGATKTDKNSDTKNGAKANSKAAAKTASIARTGPNKQFPVRIEHGSRKLHINGWGLCEWGFFGVDLYYCALHVERTSKDAQTLLKRDQAYNIHLQFVRDLTRDQMKKAYRTSVEVNTGKRINKYRERLNGLLGVMPAVSEGDNLHFRYVPNKGMTVSFNGEMIRTIPGSDWGTMFMGLYVGPNPPTKSLRKGLLGR